MILKNTEQAYEYPLNEQDLIERETLKQVPIELKEESLRFIERNSILVDRTFRKNMKAVCSRCLKAHLIKFARKVNSPLLENAIYDSFDCEVGHNGYYLDSDKIIEVLN